MERPPEEPRNPAQALVEREGIEHRLHDITIPALVVHGTADASISMDKAQRMADGLVGCSGVVAVAFDAEAPQIFVTVSPDLVSRGISAGELVKVAMTPMEGRGGGRPEMAQGMGKRRDEIPTAMAAIADTLRHLGI